MCYSSTFFFFSFSSAPVQRLLVVPLGLYVNILSYYLAMCCVADWLIIKCDRRAIRHVRDFKCQIKHRTSNKKMPWGGLTEILEPVDLAMCGNFSKCRIKHRTSNKTIPWGGLTKILEPVDSAMCGKIHKCQIKHRTSNKKMAWVVDVAKCVYGVAWRGVMGLFGLAHHVELSSYPSLASFAFKPSKRHVFILKCSCSDWIIVFFSCCFIRWGVAWWVFFLSVSSRWAFFLSLARIVCL